MYKFHVNECNQITSILFVCEDKIEMMIDSSNLLSISLHVHEIQDIHIFLVLSRNHALIWYENGKFYLQDTKSSNGTFVNNQRLSKGSEESVPREVCSGDILQVAIQFCNLKN